MEGKLLSTSSEENSENETGYPTDPNGKSLSDWKSYATDPP